MRPAGEISQAILTAACELVREECGQRRGPTLKELAAHACVGYEAAMHTVKNLTRAGKLEPVAQRQVDYRNRPVAEYAPPVAAPAAEAEQRSFWEVEQVFTTWARG